MDLINASNLKIIKGYELSVNCKTSPDPSASVFHSTPKNKAYPTKRNADNEIEKCIQFSLYERDKQQLSPSENLLLSWHEKEVIDEMTDSSYDLNNKSFEVVSSYLHLLNSSVSDEDSQDSGRHSSTSKIPNKYAAETDAVLLLINNFVNEVRTTRHIVKLMQNENRQLHAEIEDLKSQLKNKSETQTLLIKTLSEKEKNLANFCQDMCELQIKIERLQENLATAEEQTVILTKEAASWSEICNDARQEIESLKVTIIQMESKLSQAQSHQQNQEELIASLKQQFSDESMKYVFQNFHQPDSKHPACQDQLHIDLNALEMLLNKYHKAIQTLQKSLYATPSKNPKYYKSQNYCFRPKHSNIGNGSITDAFPFRKYGITNSR